MQEQLLVHPTIKISACSEPTMILYQLDEIKSHMTPFFRLRKRLWWPSEPAPPTSQGRGFWLRLVSLAIKLRMVELHATIHDVPFTRLDQAFYIQGWSLHKASMRFVFCFCVFNSRSVLIISSVFKTKDTPRGKFCIPNIKRVWSTTVVHGKNKPFGSCQKKVHVELGHLLSKKCMAIRLKGAPRANK